VSPQHTATHCSTLQHTATHCNTLQHISTHCNTFQYIATHCNTRDAAAGTYEHSATHCNTIQHICCVTSVPATFVRAYVCVRARVCAHECNAVAPVCTLLVDPTKCLCVRVVCVLQHTAKHCNALQHTATHCNTLRRTTTHCDTLQERVSRGTSFWRISKFDVFDILASAQTQSGWSFTQ